MEFLAGEHLPPPFYFTPRIGVVLHVKSNSSVSIFFVYNFWSILDNSSILIKKYQKLFPMSFIFIRVYTPGRQISKI